jgi:uncharacterized protein
MANYNPNSAPSWGQTASVSQAQIDAGLRSYMLGIYNYMAIGLAVTAFAALAIFMLSVTGDKSQAVAAVKGGKILLTSFGHTIFISPLKWVIMFAPLGFIFFLGAKLDSLSQTGAQIAFYLFAAVMGVSLSTILLVYTHSSVAQVFFITSATFGALSLFAYTTKKDLSGMGTFLMIGLIGLMIASIVNIFLQSGMMSFIISVIGVLVFAGLTAWDTQRLKNDYIAGIGTDHAAAIHGALSLYLNFINMFQSLLSLFGNRE